LKPHEPVTCKPAPDNASPGEPFRSRRFVPRRLLRHRTLRVATQQRERQPPAPKSLLEIV